MATQQDTTSSIKDQLRALVRLQYVDSRIDQIEKLRGDLPDEIRDLEDEKTGLETRLAKYDDEKQEGDAEKRKLSLDITEGEGAIKKYQEQQLQVRNNREYDALSKEIEAQTQRIAEARQRIEEIEARDTANEGAREEAKQRLSEMEDLLKSKHTDLGAVLEDTKAEQNALEDRRAEAAKAVDQRYLRAYDRLRTRMRDGRAVVPLDRGAAGGFAVPPQRQVEIRQSNRIIVCEHTGRVIIDQDLYDETVEDMEK